MECIAQEPAPERHASRLLVLDRRAAPGAGITECEEFRGIVGHLRAGDLLVTNDARVFPARLPLRRDAHGRDGEILLLEPRAGAFLERDSSGSSGSRREPTSWNVLVRPAKWARKLLERGEEIPLQRSDEGHVGARIVEDLGAGRFAIDLLQNGERLAPAGVIELCERIGEVPLPPYIRRATGDGRRHADRERYQTVYARDPCAVAAPTAGLHFTEEILGEIEARGVERLTITHQVGLGTFLPLRGEELDGDKLHPEWTRIGEECGERLMAARRDGRRIVAVGTTTVRALESFALAGMPLPYREPTELFIRAEHTFRLVDALVTNFHLPRSSLLVLVCAFAGRERILDAYRFAMRRGFRFYSYGDAMFIV